VVVDPLWGHPAVAALGATNRFARHVALGQSAGPDATFTSAAIRNHARSIIGHTNYAIPAEVRRSAYERMTAHAAAGELTADFEELPLEQAPDAWSRLRDGAGTKLVVVP
jgi:NADPH2:quinone reductase